MSTYPKKERPYLKRKKILKGDSRPVGIMDSGVGGLTVLKETKALLPDEDFLYFGDSARMPYGEKSESEILTVAEESIALLENKGAKVVVLACNTVSSLIDRLRSRVPLISIVDAGCAALTRNRAEGKVGLLATTATVRSGIYEKKMAYLNPKIQLISHGDKYLAQTINHSVGDNQIIRQAIVDTIDPLLKRHELSTILLGCTHYPIVQKTMALLYPGIEMINPAEMQAKALRAFLEETQGFNPNKNEGKMTLYYSGNASDCQSFIDVAKILKISFDEIQQISWDVVENKE